MATRKKRPRLPLLAPLMMLLPLLLAAPAAQPEAAGLEAASADVEAEDGYRFVVVADSRGDRHTTGANWGVNDAALSAVFDAIAELAPQPRFVFFGGDLVFGRGSKSGLHAELAEWRDVVEPRYSVSRVYPVFGGHERIEASTAQQAWQGFKEYFDPKAQRNAADGEPGMDCRYYHKKFDPPRDGSNFSRTVYCCDYGEDRFFVLNNDCIPPGHSVTGDAPDEYGCVGHELGCGQFNWIRSHLVGNGRRHNFFFQHEPAYGTGAHDADTYDDPDCSRTLDHVMDSKKEPRSDYVRLLGFHNGTFIFSGHEHQYTWRSINYHFAHTGLNNPGRAKRSLALLLKADPVGQAAGPAVAYSYEGAVAAGQRSTAPKLRLWWSSVGGPPDWEGAIRAERDDAEQFNRRGGEVDLDDDALELMREGSGGDQQHRFVALRWTNPKVIPEGASIERAEIVFTARESSAAGPKVSIMAEATPFAFPFSQCRRDVQRRPKSAAKVSWQIGPWQRGQTYATPDLAAIIQELVDQHGFGGKFDEIQEIKTGSCGARWREDSCRRFSNRIQGEVIQLADWPGGETPYHYAVLDVQGAELAVAVRSWDGTPLPVPEGWGG